VKKVGKRFLAGVFCISTATLCLEVCLIRYFSVSQHYHFAFFVVSIAFLGFGASGSFLTLLEKFLRIDREKFLATTSLLFSVSIFSSFLLCNTIAFDFIKLAWDSSQIWLILLYYILLSLPFLFAGLSVSFAVTRAARDINRIYFADLLGAGTGTLLALFVFYPKGDNGVIVFISIIALIASGFFQKKQPLAFKGLLLVLLTGYFALLIFSPPWLGFRISSFKALPVALKYPKAEHLSTHWNAISRIDIIKSPAVRFAPGLSLLYTQNLPAQLGLTVDGDNLTAVTKFGVGSDSSLEFLSALPTSYAHCLLTEPRILILEPKGGLDVLSSYLSGARSIKVVENNPKIVRILQEDLAEFTGNLYNKDRLDIETSNVRTALNREHEEYDLIIFPLSDVFGSSSTGLYGFGENYLFTVESFTKIFRSLTPEGMVSMSFYLLPPPRQEIRALALWVAALEKAAKDPSLHITALRSWGTICLFIKKNPFSPTDIQKLKAHAKTYLFDLVYTPGIKKEEVNVFNKFAEPLYHDHFVKILSPEKRKRHFKDYLFRISPVTDDRPFFYNFFKLRRLDTTLRALGQKWLPLFQGEFIVPLLFLLSLLIASILILLPLLVPKTKSKFRKRGSLGILLYFGLIGMAYIFLEITYIQKFILFLGHPLYSASLVIASLLIASGLGSLNSKKILGTDWFKNLKWVLFLCSGLILLSIILLPLLFQAFLDAGLVVKALLTVLSIFPVGFVMGFPFPSGIRLLETGEKAFIPWAWATNAFSSVINSVSALMIAFWGGYSFVLILAGGGYLLALPCLIIFKKRQTARP
jgi:spermidine synthase